jgi:protein required for attachment to host cells
MTVSPTTKTTWIVIADGMHARILRQEARGGSLAPALAQELIDPAVHGFSRDLKSDHPGRAFDTGSGARHAMEPRHDPHEQEKRLFARRVAALINEAAGRNEFARLVLVAPPKTLGELRADLDDHARKRVTGELARDLVRTPMADLPDHLKDVLGG